MSDTEKGTQTWYRVSRYFDMGKIEAREITGTTATQVKFMAPGFDGPVERREGKDTEYYLWLPTEVEAIARARDLLRDRRDRYSERLKSAEAALADFNAVNPEN